MVQRNCAPFVCAPFLCRHTPRMYLPKSSFTFSSTYSDQNYVSPVRPAFFFPSRACESSASQVLDDPRLESLTSWSAASTVSLGLKHKPQTPK